MRLLLLVISMSLLSSCAWVLSTPSGIRALSDHNVGLASLEKEDTPYHEVERLREKQKTLRIQLSSTSREDS